MNPTKTRSKWSPAPANIRFKTAHIRKNPAERRCKETMQRCQNGTLHREDLNGTLQREGAMNNAEMSEWNPAQRRSE